jgi:hypothetical protein
MVDLITHYCTITNHSASKPQYQKYKKIGIEIYENTGLDLDILKIETDCIQSMNPYSHPRKQSMQTYVLKNCQWLAVDRWFSRVMPVSSTNKNDLHNITEMLLKVA